MDSVLKLRSSSRAQGLLAVNNTFFPAAWTSILVKRGVSAVLYYTLFYSHKLSTGIHGITLSRRNWCIPTDGCYALICD